MDKKELYGLIDEYWADYVKKRSDTKVSDYLIENSIPIIWFGDIKKYFESKIKILTVAINPSKDEFQMGDLLKRFPAAKTLDVMKDKLSEADKDILIKSYNEYFLHDPYDNWFKNSYEKVLNILPDKYISSYGYDDCENRAIHIDCKTALATNPVWDDEGLPTEVKLLIEREDLFEGLLDFLNPNVILFSKKELKTKLTDGGENRIEQKLKTKGNKTMERISYIVKKRLVIYGTNFNGTPFGGIPFEEQRGIIEEMFADYK